MAVALLPGHCLGGPKTALRQALGPNLACASLPLSWRGKSMKRCPAACRRCRLTLLALDLQRFRTFFCAG